MEKGEGQRIRIMYVLQFLWEGSDEKHPMSAAQLIEKLETIGIRCERKTIYSDWEQLELFGFDIIRTRQGAYIGSRLFELPEIQLLADAVQSSKFITKKKSAELIGKLNLLLSRQETKQLNVPMSATNQTKTGNESIYYNVDAIQEAMNHNRQISFVYWNWNEKKEMVLRHEGMRYQVSPWMLRWENDKYYLVAYDEKSQCMKHFRVDKMIQTEVAEKNRDGREQFELVGATTYDKEFFGMFHGKRETVTLRVEHSLSGVLVDRFGKDVWMHSLDENYSTAMVDIVVSNRFYGWIVGFGGKIRIEGPQWVKEEFMQLMEMFRDE